MAKLTDLPREILEEIVEYLLALHDPWEALRIPSARKGERSGFFNTRAVNRAFRAATTAVYFKGEIEEWNKRGFVAMGRRIAIERRRAITYNDCDLGVTDSSKPSMICIERSGRQRDPFHQKIADGIGLLKPLNKKAFKLDFM